MKIFSLIVLINRLVLCYASLPINVDQFWFQIIEDQSIIYQDSDQNQWVYSKLNQNGDITLSIKLNNFVGKSNLNDEYMIEDSNYVKSDWQRISQISQTFSPGDLLVESVDSFKKYPNFFQYVQSGTNFIYWQGKKYQLNGNYKSLVIDFNLSSNKIAFQYQINLTNDLIIIAFTGIYSVNKDGQFLNSNSDCIKCKSDEILQNNICISCPQGQKKLNINDNVCITVPSNCDQPSPQKTFECENYKYQISTKKCIQCSSGEQFSSTTDSCVKSCGDGHFFDGQVCKQCNQSCKTCSNDTTCDQYDSTKGSFLDNKTQQWYNNGICQKCQKGCDDCSKDQCNFCTQGYYKDTKQCKKCSANCTECSNGITCDQCDEDYGYFLDSESDCIPSDSNCLTYNKENTKQCSSYFDGFILKDSTCLQLYYSYNSTVFTKEKIEQIQQKIQKTSEISFIGSIGLNTPQNVISSSSFGVLLSGLTSQKLIYLILAKTCFPAHIFLQIQALKGLLPSQSFKQLNFFFVDRFKRYLIL
ncbi:hypothetical protein ABPG72_014542 [Tetrahymena utriculariae]